MRMRLPTARGPLSEFVNEALRSDSRRRRRAGVRGAPSVASGPMLHDSDFQLALWTLFELDYAGFDDASAEHERAADLHDLRGALEARFEAELRAAVEVPADVAAGGAVGDFGSQLLDLIESVDGPPLAGYLQREATRAQLVDFMKQRSIYHLKESDPYSFVLPRLAGRAKVALAELQLVVYGAGVPERLHSTLFADALEGCGLERRYGAYIDEASPQTLVTNNVASLFCLQRRLAAAAVGHLAAFEATSSVPCRKIAAGIERVGLPDTVAAYFHEHVEADAVHEQVAARDICGSIVAEHPELRFDVVFGAMACLLADAGAARRLLERWEVATGGGDVVTVMARRAS
jgi:hypothetical protein